MGAATLSSRAIIGSFYLKMEELGAADWSSVVAPLFTSDQDSETYAFLGMAPTMRQWIGERKANALRESGITVTNVDYEDTLEVKVKELRRDKTGQILFRVGELARRAVTHWNSLLTALIVAGASTACYDGQFFFDTDHAEGKSGTQSNALTYDMAGSAPTVAEMEAAVMQAVTGALQFKDDQGEPLNEGATDWLVMVPPQLLGQCAAALNAQFIAEAAGAIRGGQLRALSSMSFRFVSNPRLTSATRFYVFRANPGMGGAALIRQEEQGVKVEALAEGSDQPFLYNRHLYGVSATRAVSYGFWQHAVQMSLT